MNYTLFYSYQSDIDRSLNEDFIKKALNKAASLISGSKIIILKGFDQTSGNRPLAQTMFEQSRSCDIFVGDVTFTSERAMHIESIFFRLFGKTFLSRIDGTISDHPIQTF